MPPPDSFLSDVCQQLRGFVETGLGSAVNNIQVSIGTPTMHSDNNAADQVNLFFYRFEPSGFEAAPHPQDPWRLRIHCLITAMGAGAGAEDAGLNDLRLLGNVIRIFHQTPIMDTLNVAGESVRLQALFSPLTEEHINQVWQAQGELAYRPSVAYELALAPMVPTPRRGPPPLVGTLGAETRASLGARRDAFGGDRQGPLVPARSIDPAAPDWAPLLAWVVGPASSRGIALTTAHDVAGGAFSPLIWVAGAGAASVDLVWEQWDSATGFNPVGTAAGVATFSTAIDPDALPEPLPAAFTQAPPAGVSLTLPAGTFSGQFLVYATRTGGSGATVRSDPLLLTLHRARP